MITGMQPVGSEVVGRMCLSKALVPMNVKDPAHYADSIRYGLKSSCISVR